MTSDHKLLAWMMHQNAAIDYVAEKVQPHHLNDPKLEILYGLMLELHGEGQPVDPVTVNDLALNRGLLKQIGGATTVHEIFGTDWAESTVDPIVESVLSGFGRRELMRVAYAARDMAQEGEVSESVASLQRVLDGITGTNQPSGVLSFNELVPLTLDNIKNPGPIIQTPWPRLTTFTGGMHPGQLIVIGARPSVGKTAVGLHFATKLAETGPVLFNSLEMSQDEIMRRMLAAQLDIAFPALMRQQDPKPHEAVKLENALNLDIPVFFDDESHSIEKIIANARTYHRRYGLKGLVLDYLQLLQPTKATVNRQEFVADCSRRLKLLARELNIPIIALSQLNRGPEQSERRMPRLSDLRESGAIEQDADMVLLLDRDITGDEQSTLDIIIAKNRSGQTGNSKLRFDGYKQKITE